VGKQADDLLAALKATDALRVARWKTYMRGWTKPAPGQTAETLDAELAVAEARVAELARPRPLRWNIRPIGQGEKR
jgi:hypothetical protein